MEFLFIIAIIIFSAVIHEVAHGYTALMLGDHTAEYQGRLTLNPIKHLDWVGSLAVPLMGYFIGGFIIGWAKPVPFNTYNLRSQKWGEALVAISGPLANLSIAGIFVLLTKFGVEGVLNKESLVIIFYIVHINIMLAVFNLIPIPPLDGSKVLFSLLPMKWMRIRHFLENTSMFFVFIFVLFFLPFLSSYILKFTMKLLEGIAF